MFAVASLLAIPVATASAHEFDISGLSTNIGCNASVPVKFKFFIEHGQLTEARHFQAEDYNFPNMTPPIPFGHPTGNCYKGPRDWRLFTRLEADGSQTGVFKFGRGRLGSRSLEENEFAGRYQYPAPPNPPIYETEVYGKVSVERVNGVFHIRAQGWFVEADSEGGLQYGGGSTGAVHWKAHEVSP
jgi:hypothetical protein